MSLENKNFKPSLLKPILIIALVIIAVLAAALFFANKQKLDKTPNQENQQAEIKGSGLDGDEEVETVEDVEKVIAKWIEANPQAILQSVSNMQKKMMEERMQDAQKNIKVKQDDLFNKNSPQYAPKGYDATIVEFYDYNCGYCKKANATVKQLIGEDKKLRVIYKDFPILGEASFELSKVSVAVHLLDSSSFKKFHDALMMSNERTKDGAIKVAASVGISKDKLEKTLKDKKEKIEEILQNNLQLGSSVGVSGTPGFVIGEELIPGALDIETFREKIAAARQK
jgi:protein-disulfide isomerase